MAKAYRAACTPDFYLFDGDQRLVYRGQFDASRPDSGIPVTGADLRAALDAVLAGKKPPAEQRPSIGCNIKWKAGQRAGLLRLAASGAKVSLLVVRSFCAISSDQNATIGSVARGLLNFVFGVLRAADRKSFGGQRLHFVALPANHLLATLFVHFVAGPSRKLREIQGGPRGGVHKMGLQLVS